MEKTVSLAALAKSRIDNGLSRLGREIDAKNPVDSALVLFAARAVASSNAIALLNSKGYEIEALPILRVLGELAVWARWIVEKDSVLRANEALVEILKPNWRSYWGNGALLKRAAHLGFEPFLQEALLEFHSERFHLKAGHIPWDHLVQGKFFPSLSADEAALISGFFLSHVLEAMELRWPGYFERAAQMRDQFKSSGGKNGQ